MITTTLEGHTVQCRPLPALAENIPKPYCFGLVGAGLICQDVVHHLFADHAERSHVNDLYQIDFPEADQPAPMVNMVQIRTDLPDDTLHTILEESPEPYSEVSTSSCPSFPLGFGRELFMVSHDSVPIDGETSVQLRECEAKNADRQRRRNKEAENADQAARGDPPPLTCNLQ